MGLGDIQASDVTQHRDSVLVEGVTKAGKGFELVPHTLVEFRLREDIDYGGMSYGQGMLF